jgi:Protein of unknown function (DUF2971)
MKRLERNTINVIAAIKNLQPIPPKLYKYRVFNVESISLLTNQAEIWYADPRRFNDPLDCNPTLEVDVDSDTLAQLCHIFISEERNTECAVSKIRELRRTSLEPDDCGNQSGSDEYLKRLLAEEVIRQIATIFSRHGVFSLSETWQSSLMWSHYADHHRGICVEYDTRGTTHPEMGPIDYHSQRQIKASEIVKWKIQKSSEAERNIYNAFFFAKSCEWGYEMEWRDVSSKNGLNMAEFEITAVYFGWRCPEAVRTTIVKLLARERRIKLFDVFPIENGFKLGKEFVELGMIEAVGIRTSAFFLISKALCRHHKRV